MFEAASVNMEHSVQNPYVGLFRRLDQHTSRTVAEKGAGGTVVVVNHRRHLLGGNNDYLLAQPALHICGRILQCHDESGACRLYVVGIGILQAAALADNRACRGESVVGIRGCTNQQFHLLGCNAGVG